MIMDTLTKTALILLFTTSLMSSVSADVAVVNTTKIGPFVGFFADLHQDNQTPDIDVAGTDLGWSYQHNGEIKFIFGDTWDDVSWLWGGQLIDGGYDDIYGSVDLSTWGNPTSFSTSNVPKIRLGQKPNSSAPKVINPGHALDEYKTPIGAWSNGTQEYGMFFLERAQGCQTNQQCNAVSTALSCDQGLGWFNLSAPNWQEPGIMLPCIDGDLFCSANTIWGVPGTGFCVDETSTMWDTSKTGRASGMAVKLRVALRSSSAPENYTGQHVDWFTNKFLNSAYTTVQKLVPANGSYNPGSNNQNYNVATGAGGNQRVLIFGRPTFIGVNALGRNNGLYFAYADMPSGNTLDWTVHFFTGIDPQTGAPLFSTDESQAIPVDLSSTTNTSNPAWEDYDNVGQMSIVWVDHLNKWVMFYGGGTPATPVPFFDDCGLLELLMGPECSYVELGDQPIVMRTADDPWGPWSEPEVVLVGGDPGLSPPQDQYAPGGILYHPQCNTSGCQAFSPGSGVDDPGVLYGVNIVQPWIDVVDANQVDLIWNVSTWNPYQVWLMRTRLQAQ